MEICHKPISKRRRTKSNKEKLKTDLRRQVMGLFDRVVIRIVVKAKWPRGY
jgi:hypothetical protein